jgi:hypothetical protein
LRIPETLLPAYQLLLMGGILLALAGIFGWLALPPVDPPEAEAATPKPEAQLLVLDSRAKDRTE